MSAAEATLVLDALLGQHAPKLPVFAIVPAAAVPWALTGTTTVVGTLAGVAIGRRSLKAWDAVRWFVELPAPVLAAAGVGVGDRARLELALAPTDLPPELSAAIAGDPALAAAWEARSEAGRRMLREELWAVASPDARRRRIEKALRPAPRTAPPTAGLGADWARVTVRVEGHTLPGAACGPYTDVEVGLQVGERGEAFVSGGAGEAAWEAVVEVRAAEDGPRFRGDAVHGPTRDRFLYLVWQGREAGGPVASFRRAKLLFRAVRPDVLAAAVAGGRLTARVDLTDAKGMPRCASVVPPAIAWTAG